MSSIQMLFNDQLTAICPNTLCTNTGNVEGYLTASTVATETSEISSRTLETGMSSSTLAEDNEESKAAQSRFACWQQICRMRSLLERC